MPDSVQNDELANSQPTDPRKAYDAKHGTYKPDEFPVRNTAANASPDPSRKDPWKDMKGDR